MKNYGCPKCGSVDLFLRDNGNQKGLYCSEGCGWIKWVSKKELPIVEEFIKQNKTSIKQESNGEYRIEALKSFYKQQLILLNSDNNAYNRGIIKGIEIALNIMGVE